MDARTSQTELSDLRIRRMVEMARGHIESGSFVSADVYYRMVLKETVPPKSGTQRLARGEACVWLARQALYDKRLGAATDWYQEAINADPLAVDYRVEYVRKALIPMGAFKMARIEAEHATRIDPEDAEAWGVLAGVEHAIGNAKAAVEAYDRRLELAPDDPIARLDRATVALDTADYDTVRVMCEPVLKTKHRGDALHCLAMVAYREGRHEDAISLYNQAIEAGCFDPDLARWNQSLALHSIGRYREGWVAHEARGRQKTDGGMRLLMNRFTVPIWDGKTKGRVHIHQEMGHGDVIAMARYVPLVQAAGCEVSLEVLDSMVALMARSFPGVKVIPRAKNYPGSLGLPMFDYHVPMLSLPSIFGTDIDTVPWSGPYLKPDPEMVEQYRATLPPDTRKIGLCWSSGIRNEGLWLSEYGRRKSMSFTKLRPLFTHWMGLLDNDPSYFGRFVSLQVGPEAREVAWPVLSPLPEKPSWDQTAALVEALDLVITVDTSVAHLAGALGKPLIVLMHTEGSWHWMTERLDSPWYPSARLYRQKAAHRWDDVVSAVAGDLRAGSV